LIKVAEGGSLCRLARRNGGIVVQRPRMAERQGGKSPLSPAPHASHDSTSSRSPRS
jgi:hypothetical protein